MPIIWNPKTRRYVRSGRTLPPESVRRFVIETTGLARIRLTTIAENYIDHRNVAQWFTGTKAELRAMHTALGMIAQGGKAQMTPKSWGRVGQMIRSEMSYLREFERGVANGAVSDAQLLARILGYGDAGYKVYTNMVKAREAEAGMFARRVTSGGANTCDDCIAAELEGWVPADEVREIGDSQCVSSCQCNIEFAEAEKALKDEGPKQINIAYKMKGVEGMTDAQVVINVSPVRN